MLGATISKQAQFSPEVVDRGRIYIMKLIVFKQIGATRVRAELH